MTWTDKNRITMTCGMYNEQMGMALMLQVTVTVLYYTMISIVLLLLPSFMIYKSIATFNCDLSATYCPQKIRYYTLFKCVLSYWHSALIQLQKLRELPPVGQWAVVSDLLHWISSNEILQDYWLSSIMVLQCIYQVTRKFQLSVVAAFQKGITLWSM